MIVVNFPTTFSGGNIEVTATNTCGTSLPRTLMLTKALRKPKAPREISGDIKICPGTCKTYTIPVIAMANSYNWYTTGGLMIQGGTNNGNGNWSLIGGGTTIIVCAPATGFTGGYVQVAAVNCKGPSKVKKLGVKVDKIPATPNTISGQATACLGASNKYWRATSSGATSFTWTITPSGCATFTGQGTDKIYPIFSCLGKFTISATANSACGSSLPVTKSVTVVLCADQNEGGDLYTSRISDVSSSLELSASPNPVKEQLNVNFISNEKQSYTLKLMEMTGRVVYNAVRTATEGENNLQLNVGKFAAGIYLLNLQMGTSNEQIRIVVE